MVVEYRMMDEDCLLCYCVHGGPINAARMAVSLTGPLRTLILPQPAPHRKPPPRPMTSAKVCNRDRAGLGDV